ncbi:hypothetical protein ASPVEDRAFT_87844 [Aspergillus versicolor CBS 583.65]|uniref:dihydrolipoyllysine-residue succinyltransferase n=1 Tax=Aspergillus versicolor CBS 583.65 TaxID=1036611 RepID=A0A1L9PYK3_ASPVE|nr:uncharacterized protein ASPVEDRAFT_87844 [Aspergillus versicolor CBS 583.65]OJJ06545.1 hypothetical protein ASPVEDRAFT_87844 [Aspergillus versicolor CBS 583.65]
MIRPSYLRSLAHIRRRLGLVPSPPCRAYSHRTRTIQSSRSLPFPHKVTLLPFRPFSVSSAQYDSNSSPNTIVRVPPMAESITEGTLGQFNKAVGDFIEADEELASIQTDKIDVSVNAPRKGVITKLLVAEGDAVVVDQEIAEVGPGDAYSKEDAKDRDEASQVSEKSSSKDNIEETMEPSTHRQSASSTAEREDSQPSVRTQVEEPALMSLAPAENPEGLGETQPSRAEEVVKMTRMRQTTAKRLKESQNTAAFLTTFNEVDMSRLINFRKKNKDGVLEKHGVKLGFMGPMTRASALALKEIPAVNASIEGGDTIVYRDYVDLSVAAAVPKGLVTPVLRNVESMSISEIERGIAGLVKKARDGKLTLSDLSGGTFTISNSGIWGSLFGTPIINLPQTAVLGTYGIQDRPVAVDGRVEIRPMMYIALTYDHRIIDGREAVIFLNLIKTYLEDPERMLLE